MGHTVIFQDFDEKFPLSKKEIEALIDLYYRWDDTTFYINHEINKKSARGEHNSDWAGNHYIALAKKAIHNSFNKKQAIGGTIVPPTLKVACACTLVHELQHANQVKFHKGEMGFYGRMSGVNAKGNPRMKHYWGRACEREARAYVDEHINEICAFFAVDPPRPTVSMGGRVGQDEVMSVADLLCECEEVTLDDIKDELRISKVLTPNNFKTVMAELKKRGFKIKET
jgi:hypothetical protein